MPSPTSMTRPTSCMSTSASKPASWRLMISLISPALIIAFSCPLLLRESMVHSRQLSIKASVDEQAAHLGHEAAQQLPVGGFLQHHGLAAEGAAQLAGERRALRVAERHRAAHARADAILCLV